MKLACTLRLIEETFSAAAFAEENEQETARELLRQQEAERMSLHAASADSECRLCRLAPAV